MPRPAEHTWTPQHRSRVPRGHSQCKIRDRLHRFPEYSGRRPGSADLYELHTSGIPVSVATEMAKLGMGSIRQLEQEKQAEERGAFRARAEVADQMVLYWKGSAMFEKDKVRYPHSAASTADFSGYLPLRPSTS
jgi:hypothetical protein